MSVRGEALKIKMEVQAVLVGKGTEIDLTPEEYY